MALRKDKMGQCQALPTSIKDLIPDDHIVNLVIAVVKSMDPGGDRREIHGHTW
jgi:transposase